MRTDLHSHILPDMDDGARNTAESLEMLKRLSAAGVEKVVLTPHFYRSDEDINTFLERRRRSFEALAEAAVNLKNCPELILGAEVYFYPSLSSDPDFGKLCIQGTDHVLVELPFERFRDNFFSGYVRFMNSCSQKVILAHIERYLEFGNTEEEFSRLFGCAEVLCQMNCSSLAEAGMFKRKKLLGMIDSGMISALGTDAHGIEHRPPLYGKAEKTIVSKCGKDAFERICRRSEAILANEGAQNRTALF